MIRQKQLTIATLGRATYEITDEISDYVVDAKIDLGLCNLFVQHTSASLIISENADIDVRRDIEMFMSELVRDGDRRFVHDQEGPDDMPAHIRCLLTQTALTIPIRNGRCALGTWQGIFLWEHRIAPHERHIIVTLSS
ncbi:MAG: secondary thiamine-phosphate synthase enzyme [Gammaproteobacteria bacterium]